MHLHNWQNATPWKLIVLYGINNLWKSTQAHLLIDWLREQGIAAEYLKYAIYDLAPSGPMLNDYLRNDNPYQLSPREFQLLQVLNRTQYQSVLESKLANWTWIIAEDYVGTGIAWGMGAGLDQQFLTEINLHLRQPDLELFFDGERFQSWIEKNHQHEQNDALMQKVRLFHQELAEKNHWIPINANRSKEEIQKELQAVISENLL